MKKSIQRLLQLYVLVSVIKTLYTQSTLDKDLQLATSATQPVVKFDISKCYTGDQEYKFWDCTIPECKCHDVETSTQLEINIVLAGISFGSTLIMAILYFCVKEIREKPGDILFMISISDFIWSMSWIWLLFTKLQTNESNEVNDPGSEVCKWNSLSFNFTRYLKNSYELSFFFYYVHSLRTSLKSSRIPHFSFHLGPILFCALFFWYKVHIGQIGMSFLGVCTTRTSMGGVFSYVLIGLFVLIPAYTLYYTQKYTPKNQKYFELTRQFLDYYKGYVIVVALVQLTIAIMDLLIIEYGPEQMYVEKDQTGWVFVISQIMTYLRVSNPFVLIFIRLNDPLMKKPVRRFLCCCCRDKYRIRDDSESVIDEELQRDRMMSLDVNFVQRKLDKATFVAKLQHSLRVQVVYSILSSLHHFWSSKKLTGLVQAANDEFYKKESKVTQTYQINDKLFMDSIPELFNEIKVNGYEIADGVFKIYAPRVFEEIIDLDKFLNQMASSLDLSRNFNRILKSGINTGGKSGEFFFFSSDNKLIIKTISQSEYKIMLGLLPTYSKHFKEHPFSMIAKIYGLFSFERFNPYEKFYLILMKNVNGYASDCIERMYDLKGSTVGRVTIKDAQVSVSKDQLKFYKTLKDLDFNKYEQKFQIDGLIKGHFYETLKHDAEYLSKHGLIDYSLACYIINKEKMNNYLSNNLTDSRANENNEQGLGMTDDEIRELMESKEMDKKSLFDSMPLTDEPFIYRMGIIDYLTKYTFRKSLEKFFKKLAACNPSLDVSVQNPRDYAERFAKYMDRHIF